MASIIQFYFKASADHPFCQACVPNDRALPISESPISSFDRRLDCRITRGDLAIGQGDGRQWLGSFSMCNPLKHHGFISLHQVVTGHHSYSKTPPQDALGCDLLLHKGSANKRGNAKSRFISGATTHTLFDDEQCQHHSMIFPCPLYKSQSIKIHTEPDLQSREDQPPPDLVGCSRRKSRLRQVKYRSKAFCTLVA